VPGAGHEHPRGLVAGDLVNEGILFRQLLAGSMVKVVDELAEPRDTRRFGHRRRAAHIAEQQRKLDFRAARELAGELLTSIAQAGSSWRVPWVTQTHDRSTRATQRRLAGLAAHLSWQDLQEQMLAPAVR
jgi:hypothetical protein